MEFPVIDYKKTGNQIRQLCRKKNLKPTDIQRELRLSCVQTVYKWFQGDRVPPIENFYALSLLLGVKMEEMIVLKKKDKDKRSSNSLLILEKSSCNKERVLLYYNCLSNVG